jgi:hypothetical protein
MLSYYSKKKPLPRVWNTNTLFLLPFGQIDIYIYIYIYIESMSVLHYMCTCRCYSERISGCTGVRPKVWEVCLKVSGTYYIPLARFQTLRKAFYSAPALRRWPKDESALIQFQGTTAGAVFVQLRTPPRLYGRFSSYTRAYSHFYAQESVREIVYLSYSKRNQIFQRLPVNDCAAGNFPWRVVVNPFDRSFSFLDIGKY